MAATAVPHIIHQVQHEIQSDHQHFIDHFRHHLSPKTHDRRWFFHKSNETLFLCSTNIRLLIHQWENQSSIYVSEEIKNGRKTNKQIFRNSVEQHILKKTTTTQSFIQMHSDIKNFNTKKKCSSKMRLKQGRPPSCKWRPRNATEIKASEWTDLVIIFSMLLVRHKAKHDQIENCKTQEQS